MWKYRKMKNKYRVYHTEDYQPLCFDLIHEDEAISLVRLLSEGHW